MGLDFRRSRDDNGDMGCGPAPRSLRARLRRSRREPQSVEALAALIAELVAERQELRARGAPPAAIERNRLEIARSQWELAYALIDRYLPTEPARSAA